MTSMILIIVPISLVAFGILMYLFNKANEKSDKSIQDRISAGVSGKVSIRLYGISINNYLKLKNIFQQLPMTDKSIGTYTNRFNSAACYTDLESDILATQTTILYTLLPLITTLIYYILSRDLIVSILLAFVARVVLDVLIKHRLERMYVKMLKEFSLFLTRMQREFSITNSPLQALHRVKAQGTLIMQVKALEELLENSSGDVSKLNEFLGKSSFRLMSTFAIVCFSCEDNGDTFSLTGESNFTKSVRNLIEECNIEIRKYEQILQDFPTKEKTILLFIALIPVLMSITIYNILPQAAIYLYGKYGYFARAILILGLYTVYNFISTINDSISLMAMTKIRYIQKALKKNTFLKRLTRIVSPKSIKGMKKETTLVNASLTNWNLEYLTAERIFHAILFFIVVMTILIVGGISGKIYELANINPPVLGAVNYDAEEQKRLIELDDNIFRKKIVSEDKLTDEVAKLFKTTPEDEKVKNQLYRIELKKKNMSKPLLPWYVFAFAVFCGILGYHYPTFKLKRRTYLLKEEEEDDALQLQTLILVLMDIPLNTLQLLEWMVMTSTAHKNLLKIAIHNYPSDPYGTLDRLSISCSSDEMKRIVEGLKSTVDSASIQESFASLEGQRTHIIIQRNQRTERIFKKRVLIADQLISLSFYIIVTVIVLIPMIMLTGNMFMILKNQGIF